MKKMFIFLIFLAVIISVGYFFIISKKTNEVCFKEKCFHVEIADNFAKRELGLMFRSNLNKDHGMLFIFPKEGIYPFWMKNTFIPLDIIWLNANKEVVYIKNNAQPCKGTCTPINPGIKAKYVLEISPGSNISIGDKAQF